jgi:cytochrome b6-f complex iron-sulfur subunit
MKEEKQSRRNFLFNFGIISAAFLAAVAFIRNVFLFLVPPRRKKKYHKYLVAEEQEIPVGQAKQITISKKPVFVLHMEDGYHVYSGICTHLGCIVRWEEDKQRFYCPCHKGVYDKHGNVISGPPPRPLDQFEVVKEGKLVYIQVQEKPGGPWA